jgi:Dolichyl-phosphate-mannose-protein mannosyltransferase
MLVLPILALGIAARFRQYLGCPSYWYDEAYLLLNIFEKSYTDLLGALQYNVVIPPLFLWMLRGLYLVAGSSEWVMRLPAIVACLAGLFLMIPLARRVVGPGMWVCAVGLCALSDHHLMHGCEVGPYSIDFLMTEIILLTTCALLMSTTGPRSRAWSLAGLLVAACVGPWVSFPSVFVLCGAGLALFREALRLRTRSVWVSWFALCGVCFASTFALWYVSARHLYYPGLREHWTQGWHGFPASSSPGAMLKWSCGYLVDLGDYGTRSMGIPLLLLGVLGGTVLWTRWRSLFLLLAGPIVLAGVAACLRLYPLGDRTLFFLVPCAWLLAACGLEVVVQRLPERFIWLRLTCLAVLLLPGAVEMTKSLFVVAPKVEFREAFAYVHRHWCSGDSLWVSHPEVYEVYFGSDLGVLGYHTPPEQITRAASMGRFWIVGPPQDQRLFDYAGVSAALREAHCVPIQRHQVKGLEIVLYSPPTE